MINENLTQYIGGKNGAGVYQKIISAMPEHLVYIELFLGSGAIIRRKRPARRNIGIEIDAAIFEKWKSHGIGADIPNLKIYNSDALSMLDNFRLDLPDFPGGTRGKDVLIYADPPYLETTRAAANRNYYRNEFKTADQHSALLDRLVALPCRVMISGYRSQLYADRLAGWETLDIPTTNRAGNKVIETVWSNFPAPLYLHDYQFIGEDFTDRQRIKRKIENQIKKLKRLPNIERQAILFAVREFEREYNAKN